MQKYVCFSLLLYSTLFCNANSFSASEFTDLASELKYMMDLDQRTLRGNTDLEFDVVRVEHANRFEEIVSTYGWPTIEMVGDDGARAAWIIVQHADHDKDFQRRMLKIMKPLALKDQIDPANYAYLYDRTHSPQLYGTQGQCQGGKFKPFPVEDIETIDSRRESLKMGAAEEYWETASERICGGD